jgi:hypothetical protein
MKKTIAIVLSIAAALCIFSCAKDPKPGANDANRRYFEAWLHVNYPDAKPTGLGIYIIEEEVGTRYAVADSGDMQRAVLPAAAFLPGIPARRGHDQVRGLE